MPIMNTDEIRTPAFVLAERRRPGTIPFHAHRRAQLIYVREGALTVRTENGPWVVPPQRAIWVLPGMRHSIYCPQPSWTCTLYAEPELVKSPPECEVVAVDLLQREVLFAAAVFGYEFEPGSAAERLVQVALDRLPTLCLRALHLPQPEDPRLRSIAQTLMENPADPRRFSALAREQSLGERFADRLFHKEVGMTFIQWRRKLRFVSAVERLRQGTSIKSVAHGLGYASDSSFCAMFKAKMGATPAEYLRGKAA
jgi:AraC-like DNA-binding protein